MAQIAIQVPGDTPSFFQVCDEKNTPLVRINLKDGNHDFGPNFHPDAAARAFWVAVTQFQSDYRRRLEQVIDDYLFQIDADYRDRAKHAAALAERIMAPR